MRRVTVVLPLLVLLAGCGGAGETAGSSSAKSGTVDVASRAGAAVAQPAVNRTKPVAVPRSLVHTADLAVRVHDVRAATRAAEQLVQAAGGEVADEQVDLAAADPTASLRLRVPPTSLTTTLNRLAQLGDEQSRSLGTEDVTDQVVDLDSRLATQRASVTRVRALLDRATGLGDVVRIEAELSRREADLESLQARIRAMSGQVAMSDVTVRLTSRAEPKVAAAVGFTGGLRGGWHAFTTTARVAGATVGAALPFLPIAAAAIWGALWWRRRTPRTV
jgi:hypothetical protein